MLAPIIEILIAIATFFIELTIHLLAGLFSSTYFAAHSRGILRVAYFVIALFCAYFLTALGLAITGLGGTVLLSAMFSPLALITIFALWIMAIIFTLTLHYQNAAPPNQQLTTISDGQSGIVSLTAYAAASAIVIGLLTLYSTQSKRSTLREDLCAQVETRIGLNWITKGEKLTALLEQKTGKRIFGKLNCTK